jgi:hypothetical protein
MIHYDTLPAPAHTIPSNCAPPSTKQPVPKDQILYPQPYIRALIHFSPSTPTSPAASSPLPLTPYPMIMAHQQSLHHRLELLSSPTLQGCHGQALRLRPLTAAHQLLKTHTPAARTKIQPTESVLYRVPQDSNLYTCMHDNEQDTHCRVDMGTRKLEF